MKDTLKMIKVMHHGISQQNLNLDFMVQDMHCNIDQLYGYGVISEINGNGIQQLVLQQLLVRLLHLVQMQIILLFLNILQTLIFLLHLDILIVDYSEVLL